MANISSFFPSGGGGAAIGDFAIKPIAAKANTYVDTNGFTWLKTGVLETTVSLYPDAPLTRAGSEIAGWSSHFNGGYSTYGIEYDTLNNVGIIRSASSYPGLNSTVDTIDVDSNGLPDATFTNATFTAAGSLYQTPPLYDGTDDWIAMYDGTASASTGPRYGNYTIGNTLAANDIVFKKATGGTYNAYTTTDTGKVSLSGYTARAAADWSGANSESGHLISSIGITDDHFYVGVQAYDSSYQANSYGRYYYALNTTYIQQSFTIKFNKSDGTFDEVLLDKLPINDSGSDKVFLYDASQPYTGTNKKVEHINSDGTLELDFIITKSSYANGFLIPPFYSDHNSNFYVFDSNNTHSPGTIDKYDQARGFATPLYSRALTEDTSRTQTGSGPIGPHQTSEMSGEPIYMRVL
ncbi:MAG: hypothetical protein DWQ21_09340 [Bacteroidetes bacterium]|nr:MAG: hypothetical protein DWQ21_09340 [Bacteroidota bacterium]